MGCLDEETIAALGAGRLDVDVTRTVTRHAAGCAQCWRRLVQAEIEPSEADETIEDEDQASLLPTTPGSSAARVSEPELGIVAKDKVDRYEILEKIGAGGMGVVYAAHDPELDRKVAIKLLHAGSSGSAAQTRLLREAQAMARLSHPNVSAVHDAGLWRDRVFLAMELVSGMTLWHWLRERPRRWREIVAMFLQAGRGLAAAHAAGLVHRDFKPSNVLVGADGRARVTDFGLARPARTEASDPDDAAQAPGAAADRPRNLVDTPLTRAGVIVGPPRYMAPEQYHGGAFDARADQYSFAVSLHEALFGEHPFTRAPADAAPTSAGKASAAKASAARTRPARVPPPPSDRPPARLRRILHAASSLSPDDRYPTMDALLANLARDPGRLWRLVAAAAVVVLVVGASAALAWRQAVVRHSQLCKGAERRLEGAWDAARRGAVEKAFLATGRPYAADAFASVARSLDGYAGQWAAMHTDACEATRLRGEQTDEVLALRMVCLDDRRAQLEAFASLLTRADGPIVEKAAMASRELPRLDGCADVAALRARVPPPRDPVARARVGELSHELAGALAAGSAGRFKKAAELALGVAAGAKELGYRPLEAEALEAAGRFQNRAGDQKVAEQTLSDAVLAAEAGRHDEMAARAAILLVAVVGNKAARAEEADRWAKAAAAGIERLGGSAELEAYLDNSVGNARSAQGKTKEALERYRRAAEAREKVLGPEHPETLKSVLNLAGALAEDGRPREAAEISRRVLVAREKMLGPEHPDTAMALKRLARDLNELGRYLEAQGHLERSLAIRERVFGPDHLNVAPVLDDLGHLYLDLGRYQDARRVFERARAIEEKAKGPDDPDVASAVVSLGIALQMQGRHGEARGLFERALAVQREALGPEHPSTLRTRHQQAGVLARLGHDAEALKIDREVLAIRQRLRGPEHPATAASHLEVGTDLVNLRQFGDGLDHLRRAVTLLEKAGSDPPDVAHALAVLADALRLEGSLEAAREPARRALAIDEEALGEDHPRVSYSIMVLGKIALDEGQGDEALARFQRVLALRERSSGPGSPGVAEALTGIGRSHVARGAPRDALALLERALKLREADPGAPEELAETRFALARALWDAGDDRARAHRLALAAQKDYASIPAPLTRERAEVAAWLAAHRAP